MTVPIENERRFVLRDHASLERKLAVVTDPISIRQGYVDRRARVRCLGNNKPFFTWKRVLSSGETMEIETSLSHEDFARLWWECERRQTKRRYKLRIPPVLWDIDFHLGEDGSVALVRAECEMPTDWDSPREIPSILAPHVAFEVPRGDERFSSHALCDEALARHVAREYDAAT